MIVKETHIKICVDVSNIRVTMTTVVDVPTTARVLSVTVVRMLLWPSGIILLMTSVSLVAGGPSYRISVTVDCTGRTNENK